jgi:hypothetical protein
MGPMSLTQLLYIASITGISSSMVVLLGIIAKPGHTDPDWRDVALMGSIGCVLGSRYAFKGFRGNY